MNRTRRNELAKLKERIDNVQTEIYEIMEALESLKDEEQEYLDNIPENLQGSERYDRAEQAVDSLEQAHDTLETMHDEAGEVLDSIDEACG